jgi:hypothetical protein
MSYYEFEFEDVNENEIVNVNINIFLEYFLIFVNISHLT